MNWGLLALFVGIVVVVAISNVWLRRRAEAESRAQGDPSSPDSARGLHETREEGAHAVERRP